MTRNPIDNNSHLPSWLRGVPLPPRPADVGGPSSAGAFAPDAPTAAEPVPDWLRGGAGSAADEVPDWLQGGSADAPTVLGSAPAFGAAPDADVPGWLHDVSGSPATPSANAGPDAGVPDWLRDSSPSSAAPAFGATSDDHVPDWLRDVSGSVAPAPSSEASADVPDWLGSASGSAAPAPDVPDWLSGASGSTAPASDVPDWLSGATGSTAPAPSGGASADVPDWLLDVSDSAAAAPGGGASAEAPDWLSGASGSAAPAPDAPDWLSGASGSTAPAPNAAPAPDLPDWLSGASESAPASDSGAGADVPDWLAGPAAANPPPPEPAASFPSWLSEPETPAASSTAPASDVPDWLGGASAAPQSQPPNAPVSGTPVSTPEEEGVPSWLSDVSMDDVRRVMESDDLSDINVTPFTFEGAGGTGGAGAAQPSGDVPAWLAGAAADAPAESGSWLDNLTSSSPATQSSSDAPDWLRGPGQSGGDAAPTSAQGSGLDDADVPNWLGAIDQPSAAPTSPVEEAAVPPWLSESAPVAPVEAAPAPGPSTDEAIPPWLRESGPSAPAAPASDEGIPAWLREETPAVPGAPAAPAAEEGIPAWLRESAPAAPAAPSATSADEGIPVWLREETPAIPSASAAPAAEEGIPAWLRESTPAGGATPAVPQAPAAPTEDLPPWLREEAASPSSTPAEPVPSWLSAGQPVAPTEPVRGTPSLPPSVPPAAPPAIDEVPDWLRAASSLPNSEDVSDLPAWLRQTDPASPARPAPTARQEPPRQETPPAAAITVPLASLPEAPVGSPAPGSGEDVPPWLRDESGTPLPTAGAPGDAGLPAWLRGASLEEGAPARQTPPEAPAAAPNLNWFEEPASAQASGQSHGGTESDFIGAADLPAWLRESTQQRPAEPQPEPAGDARSLDWLRRLGGPEEEAPVVTTAPPTVTRLALPSLPVRSEAHLAAVALLERLAAEPLPEAAPLPQPVAPTTWERIGLERVLYVVLLVVLLASLAVPALSTPFQTPFQVPGAAPLHDQISKLGPTDVVLVGSEWDARRVGELRPLQQAVLGQLITQKVKLVLVSTNPQGSLLLYDLRDQLVRAGYPPGGSDYIVLGYKPGGEMALRQIAQDFRGALRSDFQGDDATQGGLANGLSTNRPLNSLHDVSMVLVMADDAQSAQGWMEQVHSSTPEVPVALLLPSEAAPMMQPYTRQPNVYALAGKTGALAYEALRGEQSGMRPEEIALQSGQQRLALLVFAVLFLLGALLAGLRTTVERRRKKAA